MPPRAEELASVNNMHKHSRIAYIQEVSTIAKECFEGDEDSRGTNPY